MVRKSGPMALENFEIADPFLAQGARYIADGYDRDFIRDTMERDHDNFLMHLDEGSKIYRAFGDCAPAGGMIGTILGTVTMFANMSDPSKLGPSMATALLATLYGAVIANLITLPLLEKLGPTLRQMPNRIAITGFTATDRPGRRASASPWELSASRVISVREILAGASVPDDRLSSVSGRADTEPMFPDNPYMPANRRVTVTLLKVAPPTPLTRGIP